MVIKAWRGSIFVSGSHILWQECNHLKNIYHLRVASMLNSLPRFDSKKISANMKSSMQSKSLWNMSFCPCVPGVDRLIASVIVDLIIHLILTMSWYISYHRFVIYMANVKFYINTCLEYDRLTEKFLHTCPCLKYHFTVKHISTFCILATFFMNIFYKTTCLDLNYQLSNIELPVTDLNE